MSIPVPPVNVKVFPVVKVSFEPLSAASVIVDEIVDQLKAPVEPSVVKTWPFEPTPSGNVSVVSAVTAFGALIAIKCEPLFVPSFNFKVPPTVVELPMFKVFIALFESVERSFEASTEPKVDGYFDVKYTPPITSISAATPAVSVPVPMYNLSPPFDPLSAKYE